LVPHPASGEAAEALFELWCSASAEIGLRDNISIPSNRQKYVDWMKTCCDDSLVWAICDNDTLMALAIVDAKKVALDYIVVAENARRQGYGSILIKHVQELSTVSILGAEARNDNSKRLLEKCGFTASGDFSPSNHPILTWTKAS
jgi:GNAT superfamily N-acetyltransferase